MDGEYKRRPMMRNQVTVTVQTTGTELIGPNTERKALLIGAPKSGGNQVYLSFLDNPVAGQGISLSPGAAPTWLFDAHVGDAITGAIWAISDTGAQSITVVEFFN